MIQRIQTIFLLFTAILMGVTTFSPLMVLNGGDKLLYSFFPFGIGQLFNAQYPTWGVIFFSGLSALVPLINIFLYKKRKVQMKVGTLTSLLILFFYVTLYVYFNAYTSKYGLAFEGIQYGLILPVIALIFNVLAVLRIKKDEKLVKSLDRIR
ncbi:MAG: DUF4293 domain-containing protein [Dysgonomonas sp.]